MAYAAKTAGGTNLAATPEGRAVLAKAALPLATKLAVRGAEPRASGTAGVRARGKRRRPAAGRREADGLREALDEGPHEPAHPRRLRLDPRRRAPARRPEGVRLARVRPG